MMKPTLEQYDPMGMDMLVEVHRIEQTESGILYGKVKVDPWFTVARVSSAVTEFDPGDKVMLRDPMNSAKITLGEKDYLQTSIHNVLGRVPKDAVSMLILPNGKEDSKVLN